MKPLKTYRSRATRRVYLKAIERAICGKTITGVSFTPDLRSHRIRLADGPELHIDLQKISICGIRTPDYDHVLLIAEPARRTLG